MFKLIIQNIRDRLQGDSRRANARLGLVSPPEGSGKLIWLVADHQYESVLVAVSLLAAIREKRLDVRLVLTYQTEFKDILVENLSGLKKIGFGYGCDDSQLSANNILNRLNPFAILFIGHEPHNTLAIAMRKKSVNHVISIHHDNKLNFSHPNKSINFLSQLVQSQVDTQLGSLLCGSENGSLYHVHNAIQTKEILNHWVEGALSKNNLLVLSFRHLDDKLLEKLRVVIKNTGLSPLLLSQWDKEPVSVNQIIIADELKWYAAICASAKATHLFCTGDFYFWQAVANGGVITRDIEYEAIEKDFVTIINPISSNNSLIEYWFSLVNQPSLQRTISDSIRKIFWSARREAEAQKNNLLQEVFDW